VLRCTPRPAAISVLFPPPAQANTIRARDDNAAALVRRLVHANSASRSSGVNSSAQE
jgi:hypothetical protein